MATPLRIAIQSWPPHQWPSISPDDAANLVVLGLAVYGGLAILLVTAGVLIDLHRVRLRIVNLSAPDRSEWFAAFAGTRLTDLAPLVVALAAVSGPHGNDDFVLSGFAPSTIRSELLHHYRDWLTRAHAFTGLALLSLIAVVGLTQHYTDLAIIRFTIPIAGALFAIYILVILGGLGRLIIGSATELLVSTIARLLSRPETVAPSLNITSLESDVRLDAACAVAAWPAAERLTTALEQVSDTLRETVTRLSSTTEAIAALARGESDRTADVASIIQLNAAIQQLCDLMRQGLTKSPLAAATTRPSAQQTQLAGELRELLASFE
jgi:hypothetical protein